MAALLDLKELDRLPPCGMTLLIQDLDQMLGICQMSGATFDNTISTGAFIHFFS
jgi:hypothetical protein